ncbi:MAG: PAS domain-containing protein, partial [Candidatus Cloacimonetes bacterium]|nr:PAS domain-containing protein [Candidatus Cloacimonadota bacterium]
NLQYSKFFNYAYPYCIAVHPQNGDLLPILNANLATLSDNNYISTLRAKWFMTEQNHLPKLPFSRVQVYLGLVFLGLVYMIMLLLLFHYRKMARTKTIGLKLAIQKKNSTIQELMAIHRLFSEGPIIVLKWSDSEHEMFSFVSENINRYNYQASDLLSGKLHFRNIIHPDDLDSVLKDRYQHLVLKEYSYEQMYRIVCPSAELQASVTASEEALLKQLNPYLAKANSLDIRWILDFTFCVLDPVTKQRFFQGYLVDVTEQQIKNAEVNKNRLIAEDALAAKDLFIKGITEEIKIPLFKLHTKLGSLKLINNALLDEEGIMKIETSVQRLENVISDLQEEMNQLDKEMAHQNNDS